MITIDAISAREQALELWRDASSSSRPGGTRSSRPNPMVADHAHPRPHRVGWTSDQPTATRRDVAAETEDQS